MFPFRWYGTFSTKLPHLWFSLRWCFFSQGFLFDGTFFLPRFLIDDSHTMVPFFFYQDPFSMVWYFFYQDSSLMWYARHKDSSAFSDQDFSLMILSLSRALVLPKPVSLRPSFMILYLPRFLL
ncbi:hypothetical protein BCR42DRAFT_178823 [Absidia repens]|uniref:Uncharacterized protein n=1 Tax=Absidia repens TaxID=90262 RepID=A0A1X2HZ22_9FUNG|nr:hypothetical protein BCR42DRAFT_178823 [Absidia repens]